MADNRRAEAIDIVARRIVATQWDNDPDDLYLDDLDVSDETARDVVARAWSLVHDGNPSDDEYAAAVDYLERGVEL